VGCAVGKEINGSRSAWASRGKEESLLGWVGLGGNEKMAQGRLEDRKYFFFNLQTFSQFANHLKLNQIWILTTSTRITNCKHFINTRRKYATA
jgi:hypothetical protein